MNALIENDLSRREKLKLRLKIDAQHHRAPQPLLQSSRWLKTLQETYDDTPTLDTLGHQAILPSLTIFQAKIDIIR
jgi:hypothetical protein